MQKNFIQISMYIQYGNTCFGVSSSDIQNANDFSKSLLNWDDGEHHRKLKLGMADDDVTVLPWLLFKKNLVTFLF